MSWTVRAVQLPDGDRPVDLWVDAAGCLVREPVPGTERLPGRYVVPGLVDAHAHPAIGSEAGMPVALVGAEALNVLAAWAASGVSLVRDTGSPGGSVLDLDLIPGMPRLQAAGRFLAPAGRYYPALLPEGAPEQQLTELAKIARRLWNNLANTAKMQDQHQEDAVKNLSGASSVCSGAC